jgi:hypothetical protein
MSYLLVEETQAGQRYRRHSKCDRRRARVNAVTLPDNIAQAAQANPRLTASLAYPHRRVDAVEALDVLVGCDGNLTMAAMRLKASPQSILASVVGDENGHALLSRYLRAFTMLSTFELVAALNTAVVNALSADEIAPKEAAKTLVQLVQGMASLTDTGKATDIDPFTALMKVLPAEEREALRALVPSAIKGAAATQPEPNGHGHGHGHAEGSA